VYERSAEFRRGVQALDSPSVDRRKAYGIVRAAGSTLVWSQGFSGIVGAARWAGLFRVDRSGNHSSSNVIEPSFPLAASHRFKIVYGEGPLNKSKRSTVLKAASGDMVHVRPEAFVFCERASGAMRFRVQATPDGDVPVEWAAGLLAMHCVVRGQKPGDYTVLVVPRDDVADSIGQRAQELLEASRSTIGDHARVTRREREVLQRLLRHESNKEIGAHLNLAERTVKFHISALLQKFKARDRIELISKAAVGLLPAESAPRDTLFGFPMHGVSPHTDDRAPGVRRVPDGRAVIALPRSAAAG
jgi:DNA-binding CsgD family transcriptional regulator